MVAVEAAEEEVPVNTIQGLYIQLEEGIEEVEVKEEVSSDLSSDSPFIFSSNNNHRDPSYYTKYTQFQGYRIYLGKASKEMFQLHLQ